MHLATLKSGGPHLLRGREGPTLTSVLHGRRGGVPGNATILTAPRGERCPVSERGSGSRSSLIGGSTRSSRVAEEGVEG